MHFSKDSHPYIIKNISFEKIDDFRKTLMDCHINWQSDTPFYAMSTMKLISQLMKVIKKLLILP